MPSAVVAFKFEAYDYIAKPATGNKIEAANLSADTKSPFIPIDPLNPEEARLEHIESVITSCGGNISEAARRLDLHR